MSDDDQRRIAVVLFDGFELLNVFGPLELFGMLPERFTMGLVGPGIDPVRSAKVPKCWLTMSTRPLRSQISCSSRAGSVLADLPMMNPFSPGFTAGHRGRHW